MRPRQNLILEFWDRRRELTVKNKAYRNFVIQFFSLLLKSDIKNGDLTTNSLIEKNKKISAVITAKDDGILAGIGEFILLNKELKIVHSKNDGDKIKNGDVILKISGNANTILERERVNLNLLQRMSGIATLTNKVNKILNNEVYIAATRKTLWGLLDKKAVSLGNGLTHRLNLSDGIIIKDNHLKIINYDFGKAINSVKNKSKYIEIEIEDKKQALNAAAAIKNVIKIQETKKIKDFLVQKIQSNASERSETRSQLSEFSRNQIFSGPRKFRKFSWESNNKNIFAIMLDKINPKEVKSIVKKLKNRDLYDYVLLEASGNINPDNLLKYTYCGADVISMGFITNSAKVLNMSQEIR